VDGHVALEPLRVEHAAEMADVLGEPARALAAVYERRVAKGPRWRNWIVRVDGVAVGYVQATIADDATEVAWVIGERWRGRGYATAAARAMLAELGAERVVAHIDEANVASQGVARALGMRPTAEWSAGERTWLLAVQRGEQRA
jgi:RimJ/RimL family protein N-acetyltransferase